MTKVNTKKLLKFAGFKPCDCAQCSKEGTFYSSPFYIYPDGNAHLPPDFGDLNECIIWLVPPLVELGFDDIHLQLVRTGEGYHVALFKKRIGHSVYAETLVLAFCEAVGKVIDQLIVERRQKWHRAAKRKEWNSY